jgi:hypothetical protein
VNETLLEIDRQLDAPVRERILTFRGTKQRVKLYGRPVAVAESDQERKQREEQ